MLQSADRLVLSSVLLALCPLGLAFAQIESDERAPASPGDESPALDIEAREGSVDSSGLTEPERNVLRFHEVVVSATREATEVYELPYTSRSIDADSIRTRLAPRSLPDTLRELPGVSVQKTSPGLESPFLRGFTGFRTLLLVDEIRLNNAVFRDGPNQYWGTVDPLALESIEAVMGPSSVLYGSDAIGGTVNARTISTFDPGVHPGIYYRFSSADRAQTLRADTRGRVEKLGFSAGGTWRDFGNIDGGRHVGEQRNTGYDALSGDLKVAYDVANDVTLTFALQVFDQDDVPRTHSTDDSISWRGTSRGTNRRRDLDQERTLTYARAHWKPEAGLLESATFTLSYQNQRERESRIRSDGRRTRQGFSDDTLGALLSARTPSEIGDWTWGVEYYLDIVNSFRRDFNADGTRRSTSPRGPVADDALYGQLGVYVQNSYLVNDWAEIIVGARYNLIHASADADDVDPDPTDGQEFDRLSEDWHSLVGSARVVTHPLDWLSPFVGVSQGFRAPNLSDLTRFDASRSDSLERPNTDLDPEYFLTYEGGLHFHGSRWRSTIAYYYTDVRDLIVRYETGQVIDGLTEVDKDDIGDGYVHGVDFGAEWDFYRGETARWTAFGSFSYVEGRVDQINARGDKELQPISKGPPTWIQLGLRWTHPEHDVWIEGNYRYTFDQQRLSFADRQDTQRIPPGGTPSFQLLDVRARWQVNDTLAIFASIENIGNIDYRAHGSGSNAPGTSFSAGLDARW